MARRLLCAALALLALAGGAADPAIQPFDLSEVSLAAGSDHREGLELNRQYMLMLDTDNLLYNFRLTAGLPSPGRSYGGWEGSGVEVRGQFTGHYLSALAFLYRHTGDPELQRRSAAMVSGLREVQDALGGGYLSAFPSSFFDRLEALQPVWAPYYVIHKIMRGLLDQSRLGGQPDALKMAEQMADYHCARSRRVVEEQGEEHWAEVLDTEFGGMNEVLYELSRDTGRADLASCARLFDKPSFWGGMLAGEDVLPGLHANTHLAQANGFGARYEATGDEDARTALSNFYDILLQHHTFSTGGHSWYEHWYPPDSLGDAIDDPNAGAITEESCTQYNVLKVARYLFTWTGSAGVADFYERAILNGVIGIQRRPHNHDHDHPSDRGQASLSHSHSHSHGHSQGQIQLPSAHAHSHARRLLGGTAAPEPSTQGAWQPPAASAYANASRPENYKVVAWPSDPGRLARPLGGNEPGPGVMIYFLPLSEAITKADTGHTWAHGWGDPFETFWCCYGSGVESFSKIADSIFFKRMPGVAPSLPSPQRPAANGARLPELFVNQLVGSTLSWTELGVQIELQADLYGGPDGAATASLTVRALPGSAATKPAGKLPRFLINWRIPGWAAGDGLRVAVNGAANEACEQGAAAASNDAPSFGEGARFCTVGPHWQDGDRLEATLPMRVVAEDLNDARKELTSLKAIMMGPLLMAGVTHGGRVLDADPSRLALALSIPDASGLVSLAAVGDGTGSGAPQLLRHTRGSVTLGQADPGGGSSALDATFRLTHATRAISQHGDIPLEVAALATFECMSLPGQFLTAGPEGRLRVQPRQPGSSAQVFALRALPWDPASGAAGGAVSVELPHHPGLALSRRPDGSLAFAAAATAQGGSSGAPVALRLAPAAAPQYPRGARLVTGSTKQYLLVPLGQVVEEQYTAYFEFVPPPSGPAAAA